MDYDNTDNDDDDYRFSVQQINSPVYCSNWLHNSPCSTTQPRRWWDGTPSWEEVLGQRPATTQRCCRRRSLATSSTSTCHVRVDGFEELGTPGDRCLPVQLGTSATGRAARVLNLPADHPACSVYVNIHCLRKHSPVDNYSHTSDIHERI